MAPSLHKEPVRLVLRLLGHFQPAEQLRAFTDMMQSPGPVTFPSGLRDVMGCTYTYRCGPQLLGKVLLAWYAVC